VFSWVSPRAGTYVFAVEAEDRAPLLAVFSDCAADVLLGCAHAAPDDGPADVIATLAAGQKPARRPVAVSGRIGLPAGVGRG
jgi:hypothetical protein